MSFSGHADFPTFVIDAGRLERNLATRASASQKCDQAVIVFPWVPELKTLSLAVRVFNERGVHHFAISIATSTPVGVRSAWLAIVGALLSVPINLRMLALTMAGHWISFSPRCAR